MARARKKGSGSPREYNIPKPDSAQTYLDLALSRGSKRALLIKGGLDRVLKARNQEEERFREINGALVDTLTRVHDAYPSFDQMSEFMRHLFALDLDVGRAKLALGGLHHAITTIKGLTREHQQYLRRATSIDGIVKVRSAYIGRVSSIMRQTGKHLEVLVQARDVLRGLPSLDDTLFTVAIAGFPNVGKSTLLAKLTTAKPEIKPYAFTTKGLNVGYFDYKYNQVQLIDTPGTLNRRNPNPIERKADATIKYLAHAIIYVFDPTEQTYPMDEQEELLSRIDETGKHILIYVSKTDIVDKKAVDAIRAKHDTVYTEQEPLQKELVAIMRKEFLS
jgi:nucleolar GTP-binding protein